LELFERFRLELYVVTCLFWTEMKFTLQHLVYTVAEKGNRNPLSTFGNNASDWAVLSSLLYVHFKRFIQRKHKIEGINYFIITRCTKVRYNAAFISLLRHLITTNLKVKCSNLSV
jgi:hypothetical protein